MAVDLIANQFFYNGTMATFVVTNTGNTNAGASTAGIYISSDETVTTADTLAQSFAINPIQGNSDYDFVQQPMTIPSGLATGWYFVAAIANIDGAVTESDATNNTSLSLNLYIGTAGADDIRAKDGSDIIQSGGGNDHIADGRGGEDAISAGDGDDKINIGFSIDDRDTIDGGAGYDALTIYGSGKLAGSTELLVRNIEHIRFTDIGVTDNFALDAQALTAGQTLSVDGSALSAARFDFNGSAILGGKLIIVGGAANDQLYGSAHSIDVFQGGAGQDVFTGNGGHNYYKYLGVTESTSSTFDVIAAFDGKIDRIRLPETVNAVDKPIVGGQLNFNTFDQDLANAVGAGQLAAHHAVLFTPTSGDEGTFGHLFLVIDANGVAGYQAGQDYVIEIANITHQTSLDAHNFI